MKKRILATILSLVMLISLMPTVALADEPVAPVKITPDYSWYSADTTTYEIDSIEDLAGLAMLTQGNVVVDETTTLTQTDFKNKTVKLGADLTFASNQYWYYNDGTTTYDYRIMDFAGTFDGTKTAAEGNTPATTCTIYNMNYYNSTGQQTLAFFEEIVAGGSIKNLTIDTVNVNTAGGKFCTVVGTLYGTAVNCHAKNVTVNSSDAVTVYGFGNVSGADASADKCTVDGFYPTVTIAVDYGLQGGGFGSSNGGSITNCTVENMTATSHGEFKFNGFGNINGGTCKGNTVEDAVFVVKETAKQVKENSGFGNIIGNVEVEDCHVNNLTFTVEGVKMINNFGAFSFKALGNSFKNCSVTDFTLNTAGGKVTNAAGFVAQLMGVTVENCYVNRITFNLGNGDSTASQSNIVGFIAQAFKDGSQPADAQNLIKMCYVSGLTINLPGTYGGAAAGFIGDAHYNTTIEDCAVTGTINAPNVNADNFYIGGFASSLGWKQGSLSIIGNPDAEFIGCTADVDITANCAAGGFIAQAKPNSNLVSTTTKAVFTDCVANGDVTSINGVAGGFAAITDSGSFNGCQANGNVSGVTAGGFVGELRPNQTTEKTGIVIGNCAANGAVLGSDVASGFVGTVATADENNENATSVTISNSTAAPLVAGANSTTEIFDFSKDVTPETSTSTLNTSAGNAGAKNTLGVDADTTLTMSNGEIIVPDGATVQFNEENPAAVPNGGTITTEKLAARDELLQQADSAKAAIDNNSGLTNEDKAELKAKVDTAMDAANLDVIGATNNEALELANSKYQSKEDMIEREAAARAAINGLPNLSPTEQKTMKDKIDTDSNTAIENIDNAATSGDVTNAENAGEAVIQLDCAKAAAISDLDMAGTQKKAGIDALDNLSDAKKAELKSEVDAAIAAAVTSITGAVDIGGVNSAKTAGLSSLDGIYTGAVAEGNLNAGKLLAVDTINQAAIAKKGEIDALTHLTSNSIAELTAEVDTAAALAITNINSATTSADVTTALNNGISAVGAVTDDIHTITFDADGGSVSPRYAYTDTESKLTSLPTPTKSGYAFTGWYLPDGTTKVDETYIFSADTTLTAKWTYIYYGPTMYSIEKMLPEQGTLIVNCTAASKGTTVTITATPNDGYELDELTVIDARGNELALTSLGNGKYSFTMPARKVTVSATFEEKTPSIVFTDVFVNDYYYDAVYWAVENGITKGTNVDPATFSPLLDCTRSQAVTFLWRSAGSPEPKTTVNPFTDVPESEYYYKAVLWAFENGITYGTNAAGTTFSPEATVTRAQVVTFLYRLAGSPVVYGSNNFVDVPADEYYANAVRWAVATSVTNGTSTDPATFSPELNCDRSQIVTFLYRHFVK